MTYQTADCRDFTTTEHGHKTQPASIWSGVTGIIAQAKKGWAVYKQHRTDRLAFRQMLALDDELLDDIGVTRANVEWASQLPLNMSASRELEELSRDRRQSAPHRARAKQRP